MEIKTSGFDEIFFLRTLTKEDAVVKNLMLIIPCFLFLGCSEELVNYQESSKEEAIYKSQSLETFNRNVFYFSVSSVMQDCGVLLKERPVEPKISKSSDSSLRGKTFVHILVNEDKDGKLWLIFLNDMRPPEIVFAKKLN